MWYRESKINKKLYEFFRNKTDEPDVVRLHGAEWPVAKSSLFVKTTKLENNLKHTLLPRLSRNVKFDKPQESENIKMSPPRVSNSFNEMFVAKLFSLWLHEPCNTKVSLSLHYLPCSSMPIKQLVICYFSSFVVFTFQRISIQNALPDRVKTFQLSGPSNEYLFALGWSFAKVQSSNCFCCFCHWFFLWRR